MNRPLLSLLLCLCALVSDGESQLIWPLTEYQAEVALPGAAVGAVQPHGAISRHVYMTNVALNLPESQEVYYVYTPPNYDPSSDAKYPVLYLLHGFDQNALGWQTQGDAVRILDDLIVKDKARPMIVVMPLGYGDWNFLRGGKLAWLSPARINENVVLFSRMLLGEIIPKVESEYPISKKRSDRAIAGLSMGGREAISIGLDHPKMFAWVGGFSAAFPDVERFAVPPFKHKREEKQKFWIACGVADRAFIFRGNMRVVADLNQQGRDVTTVVTHGLHDWPVWKADLKQFLPLLFQDR